MLSSEDYAVLRTRAVVLGFIGEQLHYRKGAASAVEISIDFARS
ncbi:hypothetical protein [Mesorhizobium sp. M7A.F.Ca.MR.176.00.0.0]|nr:hypothetical protein [Mesorhizobium sp. M7A.F.Ca.MR.176.00.0.0]